jgi:formylglycine-generating enzyme
MKKVLKLTVITLIIMSMATVLSGVDSSEIEPGNSKTDIPHLIANNTELVANNNINNKTESNQSPTLPDNFVFVEGGTFHNGTSEVTLSSFYIDKYEVTQASYQAVMGTNPASGYGVGSNYPVYYVSWFNAIEYCNRRSMQEGLTPCYSYSTYGTNPDDWPAGWNTSDANHSSVRCNWTATGYRLPTEMEWMFAAKGGNQSQGYTYSGSNTTGDVAWYYSNSGSTTHAVGTKSANELGTFDMSGNVWEWCWDIDGSYQYPHLGDRPSGSKNNPTGASSGSNRVLRGGSWFRSDLGCDVSESYSFDATSTYSVIGFRILRVSP